MNPHNRTLIPRIGGRFAVLVAVLLFAVSGLADTVYNNFTGYSDYWYPFGNPNTATYGELFTSPNNADHNLVSFSFYMGTPTTPGNIITGAYIATWTGSMAGTLLYSAGPINYDNLGNEQITINTGGLALPVERTADTKLGRQPAFRPGAGGGFPDASGNGPSRWHRRPAPQAVLNITIRSEAALKAPLYAQPPIPSSAAAGAEQGQSSLAKCQGMGVREKTADRRRQRDWSWLEY